MSGIELVARLNRLDPEVLRGAVEKALEGLDVLAAFVVGSAARGRFVRGVSDLDIVAVVDGDVPFRGRVVGSELGDVEVVVYSVEEWCSYWRSNPLMGEAAELGILVRGDAARLAEMCAGGRRSGSPATSSA